MALSSLKQNPYFKKKKVEMSFFDDDNHRIGNRRFVMLCKDLDNGHYYFVIDGQKIYVSEYEYLESIYTPEEHIGFKLFKNKSSIGVFNIYFFALCVQKT